MSLPSVRAAVNNSSLRMGLFYLTILFKISSMESIRQEFAQLLRTGSDVLAIYLFGSRSTGHARVESDVDLAILFDPKLDHSQYVLRRLHLMNSLSSVFIQRLDLIVLNQVTPLLQFRILQDGIVLFEKSAELRIEQEMHILSRYYDARRYYEYHFGHLMNRIEALGLGANDGYSRRSS
jgi:hypothetical protein